MYGGYSEKVGIFMKWIGRRESSNVNDMRSAGSGGFGGNGGGIKLGGGSLVIVVILYLLFGPGVFNNDEPQGQERAYISTQKEEEYKQFVSVILADTEDVWNNIFAQHNIRYREPKMVIFNGTINSGCGYASEQMGPFYCPLDETIYIDLSFYDKLKNEYGAPGDFAMAYVIAHEVGHHVQNLTGVMSQVQSLRDRLSTQEYNKYSVRLELQADYYAGVFAKYIKGAGYLEEGDIEEAMNATYKIGDDILQKKYQGYVVPDSFTHGTSEQRQKWFLKGFDKGTIEDGDTFTGDI